MAGSADGLRPVTIENKSLYRKLAVIALPMAMQELISCSLNFVDNLMVGSLGETELSAVGVGVQVFFIHWMVLFGFVSGTSTFTAQFFGSKEIGNIRKTIGLAVTVACSVGVIFFLAAFFIPETVVRCFSDIPEVIELATVYVKTGAPLLLMLGITVPFTSALKSTQQTKLPFFISLVTFSVNTGLNYILIFGKFGAPMLGVKGAALATMIARAVELTLVIIIVFIRKNIIAGPIREFFGWKKDFALRIIKNSVPTTINETLWGLGTSMYVAAYARIGVTEYAAVQAANTIQKMFNMTAFSVGGATLILVGQKLGEGELDYAAELGRRLVKIGTFIGAVFGLVLIAAGRPLISLFEFTDEARTYCFIILVVYGLFMGLTLHNGILITGVLRAGGDTKYAMICESSCIWAFGVPTAFITALVFEFPVYICALCVAFEDLVKFFFLHSRFKSNKWVRNVVNDMDSR
ncbi:MAG: MATE family efflux transporter [Firmicutes bacterium]|nr:MATE family efflux transporter [Bacillota bacterium]